MTAKPRKSSASLELEKLAALSRAKSERAAEAVTTKTEGEARALLLRLAHQGKLATLPGLEGLGAETIAVLERRIKFEDRVLELYEQQADVMQAETEHSLLHERELLRKTRERIGKRKRTGVARTAGSEPSNSPAAAPVANASGAEEDKRYR